MSRLNTKDIVKLQNRILNILMHTTEGFTCSQVAEKLGAPQTATSLKKVKRHLEQLRNDKKNKIIALKAGITYKEGKSLLKGTDPISWKFEENKIAPPEDLEAIMLVIAQKASKYFLSPSQRQLVNNRYRQLSLANDKRVKNQEKWQKGITLKSRYPSIYPVLGSDYRKNEEIIYDALLKKSAFTAKNKFKPTPETLFPFELVLREQVQYVKCYSEEKDSTRTYAINRLSDVKPSTAKSDHAFELFEKSEENFSDNNDPIHREYPEIKLKITGRATTHFTSMQFHEVETDTDRTIIEPEFDENDSVISTTLTIKNINYTYDFKSWLLGLGSKIIILAPQEIKDDIVKEITDMQNLYIV